MARKRRALVLAGGGARGAFQVGMLEALVLEQRLDFDVLRGVSVGALNAAFLAQAETGDGARDRLGEQVRALKNLWLREIRGDHSVYGGHGGFLRVLAGGDSLHTLTPLRRLLERHLDEDRLRRSGRDFAVGTTSLLSGRYESWTPEQPDFLDHLLASASVPAVFPFVRTGAEKTRDVLVDGGVRNITPLAAAFDASPPVQEIYVLLTSRVIAEDGQLPRSAAMVHPAERWDDSLLGTKISAFDVLARTLDLLTDEIYLEDLRAALAWNEAAGAVEDALDAARRAGEKAPAPLRRALGRLERRFGEVSRRRVAIHVLAPREWYGDRNSALDFSPSLIRRAVAHGRRIARDPSLWLCHHR